MPKVKAKKEVKTKLLKGLLIDPYKQELQRIEIAHDLDTWYKVLRCDYVEHLAISSAGGTVMDLWFDEEGAIKDLLAPRFKFVRGESCGGGEFAIHGYGLVLSSRQGETIGLETNPLNTALFATLCGLQYEIHERSENCKGRDFIEEQLRMIDLELPGKFKYLNDNE